MNCPHCGYYCTGKTVFCINNKGDIMNAGTNAVRLNAASNIMERLGKLQERAENLATQVEGRLSQVVRQPNAPKEETLGAKMEEMPPLFSNMRELILAINVSLTRIEGTLERLEL
jgi:hypothetical protein